MVLEVELVFFDVTGQARFARITGVEILNPSLILQVDIRIANKAG